MVLRDGSGRVIIPLGGISSRRPPVRMAPPSLSIARVPLTFRRSRRLSGALAWALLLLSSVSGQTSACLLMSDGAMALGTHATSSDAAAHVGGHHEHDANATPAHGEHGSDFAPCPLSATCSGALVSDVMVEDAAPLVALDHVTPMPPSAVLRSVVRAPEPPPPRAIGRA